MPKIFVNGFEPYKYTGKPVFIYGDPAGLYGTGKDLRLSEYEKIRGVLVKNGFTVKVMVKRPNPDDKSPFKERLIIPISERISAVNAMLCSGEDPPKIRIKINPKCEHLIKSLKELSLTEDGTKIDKKVDKNAGRASNKAKVLLMSHPSDAFGYYIFKRFPVFKNKTGVQFIQFPGDSVMEIREGKVINKDYSKDNLPEYIKERREERKKRLEERKLKREEKRLKKERSLKSFIDMYGPGWG